MGHTRAYAGRLSAVLRDADGCRLWDADRPEYIDFMCSWGPVMRGHHDADVDAAAAAQARAGDVMNGPAPVLVELAEFFTALVAHADWALFAKNGTDATTIGVTTARGVARAKAPRAAASIFVTSSFWRGAVAMASALATLRKLQALDGITHIRGDGPAAAMAWTRRRGPRLRHPPGGPPQTGAHKRTFKRSPESPTREPGQPGSRANWPTRCTSTWLRGGGCGGGGAGSW